MVDGKLTQQVKPVDRKLPALTGEEECKDIVTVDYLRTWIRSLISLLIVFECINGECLCDIMQSTFKSQFCSAQSW